MHHQILRMRDRKSFRYKEHSQNFILRNLCFQETSFGNKICGICPHFLSFFLSFFAFSLFHLRILIFLFLPSLLNLTTTCFQNHVARFQLKLDLVCYRFFFVCLFFVGWGQAPLLFLGYSKHF